MHPHIPGRRLLDSIVLGGSDGIIEGLAMTAALNGAGIGFGTVALSGLAFAAAGAISISFSYYLSGKSELESLHTDIKRERMEIETEPEEEMGEMVDLLRRDGYAEAEIKVILGRLAKDKDLWLREMLRRELKVDVEGSRRAAHGGAAAAGMAFFLLALAAVSPYLFAFSRVDALAVSATVSLVALFVLGSRLFLPRSFRLKAGLESVAVGALGGAVLYAVGLLLSGL